VSTRGPGTQQAAALLSFHTAGGQRGDIPREKGTQLRAFLFGGDETFDRPGIRAARPMVGEAGGRR